MVQLSSSWLVLSYACNNDCVWCYAKQNLHNKTDMSLTTLCDSLDFLQSLGLKETILIGGEPTIYPHLNQAITGSLERGIEPILITNGRRLSDANFLELLTKSKLKKVCVSIESLSAESHDSVTQRQGSFRETWQGLANAIASGMEVSTATTISPTNSAEVIEVLQSLSKIGVGTVGFNIVTPNVDGTTEDDGHRLTETVRSMQKVVEDAGDNTKIHFASSIPLCLVDTAHEADKRFRGNCCVFDGSGLVIEPNGKIIPCVHWIGAEISSIYRDDGVLRSTEEFLEDWNGGIPLQFRQELLMYPAQECIGCAKWDDNSCVGGCPLLRLNKDIPSEIAERKGGIGK